MASLSTKGLFVTSDGSRISQHRAMGLVPEVFTEDILRGLEGHLAVGHVRYSTTGASHLLNAQPFTVSHRGGTLAVAHNGNLVNTRELRDELEEKGAIFQTTMDTEVVVHLLARNSHLGLEKAITKTFSKVLNTLPIISLT